MIRELLKRRHITGIVVTHVYNADGGGTPVVDSGNNNIISSSGEPRRPSHVDVYPGRGLHQSPGDVEDQLCRYELAAGVSVTNGRVYDLTIRAGRIVDARRLAKAAYMRKAERKREEQYG